MALFFFCVFEDVYMPGPSNLLNQPKAFYMIFSLEFWERFGYAGIQAILVVYFLRQLNYSEAKSDVVFGAFFALTFGFISIGGWLGDSYIGTKRTMVLGAVTLAIGYLLLGVAQNNSFIVFIALGTVAVGNGLFKANPSSLLSRCYETHDPRLDSAFTLYYMAINLGAMTSMFLVPYLAKEYNWSLGFYTCSIGLLICILTYFFMKKSVIHIGSKPDLEPLNYKRLLTCIVGVIIAVLICAWLLLHVLVAQILVCFIGISVLLIYIFEALKLNGRERAKMIVSLILIFEAFIFFILYAQMPTSLNFFALNNVEHNLFGFPIAPESFQMLNPVWIVIASPFLAYIYGYLGSRGRDLSVPVKFATGMVLCSIAFFILYFSVFTANEKGVVSSVWLVVVYAFLSIGELLISGLGLAMIAKLVPRRLNGFIMGAWFLSTSFAAIVAGHIASFTAPPEYAGNTVAKLHIYSQTFLNIGIVVGIISILMLITAPSLDRFMRKKE